MLNNKIKQVESKLFKENLEVVSSCGVKTKSSYSNDLYLGLLKGMLKI